MIMQGPSSRIEHHFPSDLGYNLRNTDIYTLRILIPGIVYYLF